MQVCCRSSGDKAGALKRVLALERTTVARGYLDDDFNLVDTGREIKLTNIMSIFKEMFILYI